MNKAQQQEVLNDVVRTFARQEWFRDATIYNQHPLTNEPTLVFKVNYVPMFERKEVKEFCLKYGLTDMFQKVDRNGQPTD